jgi:hypothetical protein
MTEPQREPDIDLTDEAKRARDLLKHLEAPRADREFRARLKEEFVAGSLGERREAPARSTPTREAKPDDGPRRGGIGPVPDDEPDLARQHPRPRPSRPEPHARPSARPAAPPRRMFRFPKPTRPRFAAVLAAAAAITVAIGIVGNRGAQWRLLQVAGTGYIQADGEIIPIERLNLLAERLHPGVEIVVPPSASIDIAAGSDLAMEILPGTSFTVPPAPPRWFMRRSELYARGGEIRVTTGPTFQGAKLELHTPDAMVQVTGTTLAVIMEPTGTCVCVLEGEVMVGARGVSAGPEGSGGGSMMPVTSGHRGYVFRDGRDPERADIRPTELVALAKFRSLQLELLEEMTRK